MELLHICLQRIDWQGAVTAWRTRLDQALDRVQSRLGSETDPPYLLITGFQMDCLASLCHAPRLAMRQKSCCRPCCCVMPPFPHWCEYSRPMPESDKQELLAKYQPKIHALLHATLHKI